MKEIQVTNWMPIDYKIDSEYGVISYRDWCHKEMVRLSPDGSREFHIKYADKNLAGFVGIVRCCSIFEHLKEEDKNVSDRHVITSDNNVDDI